MKVFIAWSGEPTKTIAEALAEWLKRVIPPVKPFVSVHDIPSGERWPVTITTELEENDYGILCLTRDNKDARWILFEAGALSKTVGSRVCPLLFGGMAGEDLEWPLAQFEYRVFDEAGVRRLVKDINNMLPKEEVLDVDVLKDTFDAFWQKLKGQVESLLRDKPTAESSPRTARDILAEILRLVRLMNRRELLGAFVPGIGPSGAVHARLQLAEGLSGERRRAGMEDLVRILTGLHGMADQDQYSQLESRSRSREEEEDEDKDANDKVPDE